MLRSEGYSLLELLVTLAVITIVMTSVLPGFTQFIAGNRQTAHINNFVTSLLLARSTAATLNRYTVVCPSSNLQHCESDATWNSGWVVMSSDLSPGDAQFIDSAELLRSQSTDSQMIIDSNRPIYVFRPHGRRATNGTVIFCHAREVVGPKALIISYNGRSRRSDVLSNGNALSCD